MAKLAKTTNMANRSYLYTTDNYTANDDEFTALGLSEYAHEISYLHQLMVAYDAKSIKSLIFDEDEETAVVANFEKGKQLVIDYLKMVLALVPDLMEEGFASFVDDTITFLNSRKEKYALLELGEIYDLDDEDVKVQHEEFFNENRNISREAVENLLERFNKGEVNAENLSEDDEEILSVLAEEELTGFWSETLYYDLSGAE